MRILLALVALTLAPAAQAGLILHETHVNGHGPPSSEAWTDSANNRKRTLDYDGGGKLTRQFVSTLAGCTQREEDVDYRTRLWRTITVTVPGAKKCTPGLGVYPADVRERLREGRLLLKDRRGDVLRLTVTPVSLPLRSDDLWVEAGTWRIVREVQVSVWKGKESSATTDFEWLPASAAGKAELVAPKGFKHLHCTEQVPVATAPVGTGRLTPVCR